MKPKSRCLLVSAAVAAASLALPQLAWAQSVAPDALERGFQTPPDSAKPRTWWHWTMSNVTKEGITKDLEWMKRVGIGGFMLADVAAGGSQSVEPKTPFGTPGWYEAVRHAAAEADRLGLEMAIFSSPGWSETGGPWVKPEEAMKKLVWSETKVQGPVRFSGKLPQPPRNNGQIRNTGATYYEQGRGDPTHYADSAVIAYRTPAAEVNVPAVKPAVTTHNGPVDGAALLDDQLNTNLAIPAPKEGGAAWVQYEYPEPFSSRAITIGGRGGSGNGIPVGRVLASDDGVNFRTLVTLPGAQLYRQGMVRTYAFTPTTAKFYRIEMTAAPLNPAATISQAPTAPAQQYVLSEAIFHSGAKVHRWEEKAGFSFLFEYDTVPTPNAPVDAVVQRSDVVNLTDRMKSDGSLEWDAPAGTWTVLRLGYSLTGAKTRPATPAGSGFEADKLSRKHMESYVHGYFDPLQKALGPLFGKSLRYVMMDSWEAGTNNWSDVILDDFKRRRGYDPMPYLPVLTGHIVENAEVSDRFLWDFRRTLADLWADNHYGTMAEKLRERGIGIYAEASGVSLEMPEDTLLNKSKVEIPMGEFWVRDLHPRLMYLQDVRGAASAAHVYGKKIVATESFTGGGYESPFTLKKVADYWLAQGLNRFVFHTSAHQPLDTKPGNTMVGTHIHRNITWAEQTGALVNYLARNSFMMQQGQAVADIAYLLNEGAPSTPPIWGPGTLPPPPDGYDFDFINADVLLNRMSIDDTGRLTVKEGASYRVLVLPETNQMRPELLRKLRDLVNGGAIIVGPKPVRSPSLMGHPAVDDEVRALASELWGDLDGESRTIRRVGKGNVIWGWPLDRVMAMPITKLAKDFESSRGLDTDLAWAHRRDGEVDIYYVANLTDRAQDLEMRFRVSDRAPEIFRTISGTVEEAGYLSADERTTVPVRLAEREAAFVVFRKPAPAPTRAGSARVYTTLATVGGPWTVTFPANLGAPEKAEFPSLASWSDNQDDGIKYFSGTATYTKSVIVPPNAVSAGARILLDLGVVGDMADVSVNGKPVGFVWAPPYRVDVTSALKTGENQVEVKVTNQWTNRIAGDRAAPADKKVLAQAAATGRGGFNFGGAAQPLPKSGLIGPVTFVAETEK